MNLTLNTRTKNKWIENQKVFLIPLAVLYLGFIIARISTDGVSLVAFVPTPAELTAITLYVLNFVFDYLRKLM